MWPYEETSAAAAVAVGFLATAAAALYVVYRAAAPTVPVKGKTNIPGISDGRTFPIIGDSWRFFGVADMIGVWKVLDDIIQKHNLASVWLGRLLMIIVGDPKVTELVLNSSKTTDKPDDFYGEMGKLADGVFSRNGKEWQRLRIALDKLTHSKFIMENYLDKYEEYAKKFCKILDTKCDQGIFDIGYFVKRIYIEMMTESVLGVPLSRLKDPEGFVESLSDTAEKGIIATINSVIKFDQKVPILSYFLKDTKTAEDMVNTANKYGTDCLRVRQEILNERGCNVYDPEYTAECYADVVFQIAKIENMRPERAYTMPPEMVAAGYDTPSVALSSSCLFLAMHPELQEKAYQEQVAIMGDSLEPPTMTEIAGMNYMEMCYKETLRHVAPPGFARLVESELVIDNYVFPQGSVIYLSTYSCRKDPKYWVKPKEFYPDHFLPEEIEKRPKGAYLPFSAGSRVCPGKHVAQTTNRLMLSTLLRRYKFTTNKKFENIKYKYLLMLEPAMGYPVKITRRTKQDRR